MKTPVTHYTFDASAGQVTLTGYTAISLPRILLVTNVTDNIILYNFANPALGGTVATNVLTLTYNTSAMSDTDELQIYYEDEKNASISITEVTVGTVTTKTLTKTVDTLVYERTVAIDSSDNSVSISTWGEV